MITANGICSMLFHTAYFFRSRYNETHNLRLISLVHFYEFVDWVDKTYFYSKLETNGPIISDGHLVTSEVVLSLAAKWDIFAVQTVYLLLHYLFEEPFDWQTAVIKIKSCSNILNQSPASFDAKDLDHKDFAYKIW